MTKKAKSVGMRAELETFKRERILTEMIELFRERSFREVTLDALAERLKVTKPFIYQFFDSKQHLLATVYERGAQQLLASIEGYLDKEAPAAKRLHDFVRSFALQNIESRAISVVFGQLEGDLPPNFTLASNTFEMEWPPRSGELQQFPEIDRAQFFALGDARKKINQAQIVFLDRLIELVNSKMRKAP